MAAEINFETWAKDCDLSPDAIEVLKKEELDSLATLQSLSDKDIQSLTLTLGQKKRIQSGIAKLQPTQDANQQPQDSNTTEAPAAAPESGTVDTPSQPLDNRQPPGKDTASATLRDLATDQLLEAGKCLDELLTSNTKPPSPPCFCNPHTSAKSNIQPSHSPDNKSQGQ